MNIDWHALLVHRLGLVSGGGVVTHYKAVDGHIHQGLFCYECGKKFSGDGKPEPAGTLADSLQEDHQLGLICQRMVANKKKLGWPVPAEARIAADVEACMRANGWKSVDPKA